MSTSHAQGDFSFDIPEAGVKLPLFKGWQFVSKTGKIERGKVQYVFSHNHVEGNGRLINPSIIVTLDISSWHDGEPAFLKKKLSFHKEMGDLLDTSLSPDDVKNPIKYIDAYFTRGTSGQPNHPYGQRLLLVTFWNEKVGFHMEVQTSEKDLENNLSNCFEMIKAIKPLPIDH